MAKQAGVDVLVKIDTTGEGRTYTAVGGQKGCTLNRSAETIDVTDKNSNGWSENMAGIKSWSVDMDGFVVLEDTALEKLAEHFEQRKPVKVQLDMGGARYSGDAYIVDFPIEAPLDDAVTYSLSLVNASPLTKGTIE